MGRLVLFITIMSVVMLGFYFTGLAEGTVTSNFLNLLLNVGDFEGNEFYSLLFNKTNGFFFLISILGVLSTRFFLANPEIVYLIPVVSYFSAIGIDFLLVFNKVKSVAPVLAIIFFAPLFFVYFVTLLEWYRGMDR